MLLGPHVGGLLGGCKVRCCFQPFLRRFERENPLAVGVGRYAKRAVGDGNVLFTNAEEAADAYDDVGDASTFLEQQIIDIAYGLAGIVRHLLTNELAASHWPGGCSVTKSSDFSCAKANVGAITIAPADAAMRVDLHFTVISFEIARGCRSRQAVGRRLRPATRRT